MNLKTRNTANIITAAILLLVLITYVVSVKRYNNHFYKTEINSVVIKSNDWLKRGIKYVFADGNHVYFIVPIGDKIRVGDSISKAANTTVFQVFRKDGNDRYFFFKSYDNRKDN